MRYAVIGGDMRFAHLTSMLNESGRQATGFLQESANENSAPLSELKKYSAVIANWPMRWPLSREAVTEAEILDEIAPGSVLLLCGPKFPKEKRWDLQYVNLWEDDRLLQENAYLTAEAAVASALRRSGRSMMHLDCAVIGYGRIGRALTEILKNLGARVTVLSRTENKRRLAVESGAQAADLMEIANVLPGKQLVFSTPPSLVLDREALMCIGSGALLMDLASPPYGFDLEEALELGLNACREPGLPGRYCPLSAARVLYHAVLRWEEAEKDG